ncbi:MAG: chitobiase/beta-hexosaminidase C-terminal domain-containing protein, partial [Leptospirales bacterium]|nr:chitobiase/beta-hexosaminidase C-terminal domain-containing protein [Leptospirales bacterium]
MKTKIVLLVSLIIFAMTSCSNVVEDSDEMTLEINFGQKSLPATIQYKIDIEGPKTFTHESTGTQPVLVKVPMGYYNISVTAFSDYRGGTVYATGDGQVTVNARYNSIPITLNIIGGAATPEAIPGAGTYTGPQNITLFTTTAGAAIYYTLDGSEPSSTSTKYTGSITISALGITTLKAIAIMSGMYDSLLLEAEYNILAVDKPEVNVPEGEVPYGTTITLNTATTGAEIRYTLDGSDPNSSCTLYTSPFTLNTLGSVTLKAIAIKAGIENSDILVAAYTVIPVGTVTKPTAAPSEGVIISGTTVELSTTTAGAEIWYTTNGVTPAKNVGTKYTTPILITVDTIIKAIAVKEGMTDSNISEITYTAKAAKPTASPGNGEVNYGTAVTLSTTTAGANIYYTTDGTTPTASSSLYSGQIVLDMNFGSVTLRAIAIKDGIISNILQAEYIILPLGEVAKPNATPSGGIVISGTTITLSTTTAGAEIRYTTNGVTPAKNVGTKYTTPILITADTIIKAIAVKEGMTDSNISEIIYTAKAAKPAASLSGSTVTYGTPVTLSTTTAGANIYYTTDGTTPTASSSLYSGQIVLDMKLGSITLKAIAVKDDMVDSDILGVAYIILPINTVATPTASPSGGGVTIGTEVTLSSTTQDAEIWYTTDDSDPIPDTVGTINYTDTNKITINDDTIIRAIAVKPGWSDSDILTTEYTILAVATPKADPPAGQVPFGTMGITLSTTTSGATIHYTRGNNTEPPTPTTSSPIYPDVPIILDNPVGTVITLKAIAVKSDMRQSDTLITSYTIISTGEVAEPV